MLAILLPLVVLTALLTLKYVRAEQQLVETQRAEVAGNLNDLADREIARVQGMLLGIAATLETGTTALDEFLRYARATAGKIVVDDIVLTDPSGTHFASLNGSIIDLQADQQHLVALRAGLASISNLYTDPKSTRLAVIVSVPAFKEGAVVHIVSTLLNLERLEPLFAEARHRPEWVSAIVDRNGVFLARSRGAERFLGKPAHPAVVQAAKASKTGGMFENVTLDGLPTASSYRRSTLTGWTSVVAVPTAILNAPRNEALQTLALIATALTAVGTSIAYLLGLRISTAIQALKGAALAVVEGRSPPTRSYPIHELQDVSRVFDYAASASVQSFRAEQRLRDSDDQLRLAIDAGGFGTWDLDLQTKHTDCSPRLYELFGFDPKTTPEITPELWQSYIDPSDRQAVLDELARAQTTRDQYSMEYRRIRADNGKVRWMRATGRFIFNDHGKAVRLIGVVRDVTDRKQIELALRDSEARYRSALTVGRIASWETNFATGERIWSPEGEALFGLSLAGGIGRIGGPDDEYCNALHPDDQHLMAKFHKLAKIEDEFNAEYRIVHPDGTLLWVAGRGKVMSRNQDGTPARMISVVADITERKHAEQHAEFLMREMSHRAKNLLSVIQSLARQTARHAGSLSDFSEAFNNRLQGLAVSQDLLVSQNWQPVRLSDLVRQQLRSFLETDQGRLVLSGPEVTIPAEHAQAIGLALHELATNAAKYGALSNITGNVTVQWTVTADDQLQIVWTESGGPPVTSPTRKGFGHQVMERMVAQSVNGTVTLEFATAGVVWSLVMPRLP